MRKTQEEFLKEVTEKFKDRYKVIGQYINNKTKIEMECLSCEKRFFSRPHDILKNRGGVHIVSIKNISNLKYWIKFIVWDMKYYQTLII